MSAIFLLVIRILMAIALYGFLGLAVYTLLNDLKQQGVILAARQPPAILLTSVVQGEALTQRYTRPEVILGREAGCDFSIDDQAVSSRHARLSYHQQQWWLEDLASTNGTYINEEPVVTQVVVTQGDEIRLGQSRIKIEINRDS